MIQNDWTIGIGWVGHGDCEAGEEGMGQVCDRPYKQM